MLSFLRDALINAPLNHSNHPLKEHISRPRKKLIFGWLDMQNLIVPLVTHCNCHRTRHPTILENVLAVAELTTFHVLKTLYTNIFIYNIITIMKYNLCPIMRLIFENIVLQFCLSTTGRISNTINTVIRATLILA